MDSIIEALEQIEALLLQQQSEINQLRADFNSLARLLLLANQSATTQEQGSGNEGKQA